MAFVLVDCNNFYCSCERAFRPDLQARPVAVLSNNDGCVVARSNEIKALKIGVGEPYFKVKHILEKHNAAVFSSNYSLYADMSRRVMSCLSTFTPSMEIYSIDEAFLEMTDRETAGDIPAEIRRRIWQWCRIPVSVGIGPTKTLAKLAAHWAKRHQETGGVFRLGPDDLHIFSQIEIGDVWGIGPRNANRFKRHGIYTVDQLLNASDEWLRKQFTVMGLRTVSELKGHACYPLDESPQPPKTIVCSRSFGHQVRDFNELREATASYVVRAAEKLRRDHMAAATLTVFVQLLPYVPGKEGFRALSLNLSEPTSYTPELITAATGLLEQLYHKGQAYKKSGIMLSNLTPETEIQLNLFQAPADLDQQKRTMQALDGVNRRHGSNTLSYAACGIKQGWSMRREMKSPHYTTSWGDLLRVKTG